MAKAIIEKLGCKKGEKLTKKTLLKRAKGIRARIKAGKFKGDMRRYALHYAGTYERLAKQKRAA